MWIWDWWGHSVFERIQLGFRVACGQGQRVSGGFGQGRDEPFRIEDGAVLEHEEDGAGQFDGNHGIGFELVAVHPGFQTLGQRTKDGVIALGDDGGFTEGPAEVGIAELGSAQALDLACAGNGAFDQATVGEEVLDGG
jgi:hypothetical protein